MQNLLTKLKLIDQVNIQLEIEKHIFVEKLKQIVEEKDLGSLSGFMEVFSSDKREYKGHVDLSGFKIKRKKKLFDMNQLYLTTLIGNFTQKGKILEIDTKINGFNKSFIPFYIFLFLFYIVFIFIALNTGSGDSIFPLAVIPFIFIHGLFMAGIPYVMMRRGVKKIKYELERDFFYLTKN